MAAKLTSVYICQQCGFQSSQFYGRCPECGTWNSLVETVEPAGARSGSGSKTASQPIRTVDLAHLKSDEYPRLSTKISEFDRVLGGGIVHGSVVLLSGDPGIGKSTLLSQLALNVSDSVREDQPTKGVKASPGWQDAGVLYVAGEESAQQIKIRIDRIKPNASLKVLNEVDVDITARAIEQEKPSLVIVDSIQTLETADLTAAAGSISQVRESAHRLQRIAKALHTPIFIVGHVTKEGSIAGPRTLEHLVDVVLNLEGDPLSNFRVLRGIKNRFGPTDEVGIFEMAEQGMVEVKNPSQLFLEQKVEAPGSAVAVIMNGVRPLLVEIQALVAKSFAPIPRRFGSGVDNNRLQLLTAVLAKRLGLPLYDQDVFVNVTGGLRIIEPAADLGIAVAIVSSFKDKAIPSNTVFIGEVGLLGELRNVRQLDKRSQEAKRLGFDHIISSGTSKDLRQVTSLFF